MQTRLVVHDGQPCQHDLVLVPRDRPARIVGLCQADGEARCQARHHLSDDPPVRCWSCGARER